VRRATLASALVAASLGLGCAQAVNYLDPAGPRYLLRAEAGAAGPGAGAQQAPRVPFRVVSFNIAYGIQVDRALEALRASEPLRDPDVLALQEMDAPGVERVARALGLNAVYFPSGVHPKQRRDFGCALLSPWPLQGPRKLVLPHAARGTGLRRAAVSAVVVRDGLRVQVYCVHLPSPLAVSGASRREQVRAILADAGAAGRPVVVAGDFNSYRVGELFARAGYAWPTRDIGPTARWALGGLRYDHVFARGLGVPVDGTPAAGVVADSRQASDHKPIWAQLVPQESEPAR
jgi:endonuclease/exonuclease/phosphatase family metal-dependent hydrolase